MNNLLNHYRYQTPRSLQSGVTLVELMVALVIGLIVSLAVYSVLTASEGRKRTTTSINDIDKAGSYAAFQLDKAIRSAGSGFSGGVNGNTSPPTVATNYTYGCRLLASTTTDNLLPSVNPFPIPFNNVPQAIRLAPLIILDGQSGVANGGDVLISMTGSGGLAESLTNFTGPAAAGSINVKTTSSINANNLILLLNTTSNPDGAPIYPSDCLLDQIAPGFVPGVDINTVPLNGRFHAIPQVTNYGGTAIIANLGNVPQFNMFTVGANNTLFQYDLLAPAGAANPAEFVDSVMRMEAIYGISNSAGDLTWQTPTGGFAFTALMAGTAAANTNLRAITMVRVALIMKTNIPEKGNVSPDTIDIFQDTDVATRQTINGLDRRFRYRVIEANIPLRNALIAMDDPIRSQ